MTSTCTVAENVATATALVREAAAGGADLVATPEMTTLMDRDRASAMAKACRQQDDKSLMAFRDLAAELGIMLLIGSMPILSEDGLRKDEKRLLNRSFLIGPDGAIIASYDKIHLFDVSLGEGESYRESLTYDAGDRAVVAHLGQASLGLSVCYDLRFGNLYRALAQAGAQVLCVPAAFTQVTGEAHWHVLLRARAIETGAFVIAPAQTGLHEDGRRTYGHSLVVGPWGDIVADGGQACGVTLASLDLAEVQKARARIPALDHGRTLLDVVTVGTRPRTGSV
jgi:predicted amidohydrolase